MYCVLYCLYLLLCTCHFQYLKLLFVLLPKSSQNCTLHRQRTRTSSTGYPAAALATTSGALRDRLNDYCPVLANC